VGLFVLPLLGLLFGLNRDGHLLVSLGIIVGFHQQCERQTRLTAFNNGLLDITARCIWRTADDSFSRWECRRSPNGMGERLVRYRFRACNQIAGPLVDLVAFH